MALYNVIGRRRYHNVIDAVPQLAEKCVKMSTASILALI